MLTPESLALSQLKEEFDAFFSASDWERALDLMVLIARTLSMSEDQGDRRRILYQIRDGKLPPDLADLRRDEPVEAIVQMVYIGCAQLFPFCLGERFGASELRRFAWLDAWTSLRWYWQDEFSALSREHDHRLDQYLEEQDEATWRSAMVTAEEVWSECGLDAYSLPEQLTKFQPEEDNDYPPSLADEFDSFLASGDVSAALDLLPILNQVSNEREVVQLVRAAALPLARAQAQKPGVLQLHCRLWNYAFNELSEDLDFDELMKDLEFDHHDAMLSTYDGPKFERSPWTKAESHRYQATTISSSIVDPTPTSGESIEQGPVTPAFQDIFERFFGAGGASFDSEASDDDASQGEEEQEDDEFLQTLRDTAYRHLVQHGLPVNDAHTFADNTVPEAQAIWSEHASITSSWNGLPGSPVGYGAAIRSEIDRWSQRIAEQYWPKPLDHRTVKPKRNRRAYESTWVWSITSAVLGALFGLGNLWLWAVLLCAGIGWLFSANYSSISTPALEPLPDPNKESRNRLARNVYDVGIHVCKSLDNQQYSSHLSADELRAMVHDAWQPKGPRPSALDTCTPREAEFLCARWMSFLGSADCVVTQATRDGGADIVSSEYVGEVKHQAVPVGVQLVRQILGVATSTRKKAAFFSLNGYTASAQEFANANDILLFQYSPENGTLAGRSKSGTSATERGLAK